MPLMREHFANRKPMGALHQGMMRSFREYMLVGGMPQVVQAFVNGKDFGKADFVKQQIITLYKTICKNRTKKIQFMSEISSTEFHLNCPSTTNVMCYLTLIPVQGFVTIKDQYVGWMKP